MANTKSKIGWTDSTWSPTVGCTRVSAGCRNCYAFSLHNKRYAANVKAALAQGIDGDPREGTQAQSGTRGLPDGAQ